MCLLALLGRAIVLPDMAKRVTIIVFCVPAVDVDKVEQQKQWKMTATKAENSALPWNHNGLPEAYYNYRFEGCGTLYIWLTWSVRALGSTFRRWKEFFKYWKLNMFFTLRAMPFMRLKEQSGNAGRRTVVSQNPTGGPVTVKSCFVKNLLVQVRIKLREFCMLLTWNIRRQRYLWFMLRLHLGRNNVVYKRI